LELGAALAWLEYVLAPADPGPPVSLGLPAAPAATLIVSDAYALRFAVCLGAPEM